MQFMLSWRSFTQTGEKISGKVYRIYTNLENISMKSLKDKQDRKLMKWNNKFRIKINYNKNY